MRYYCTEQVNRTRDEVFSKYSSIENLPLWFENFVHLEPFIFDEHRRWTHATLFLKGKKGPQRIQVNVLDFDPPKRIVMRFSYEELTLTNTTTFEDHGSTTMWRQEVLVETRGINRLLAYSTAEGYKKCTQMKMARFKAFCEQQSGAFQWEDLALAKERDSYTRF